MTVQFPAFCPSCGLIFKSQLLGIEGQVQGLTLSGNRESCPRCDALAELPDGTFNVVDDTIEVLSATELTRDRLLRLSEILDETRTGQRSAENAADAIANEAPSLRRLFERYGPEMRMALVSLLIMVIGQLLGMALDDSATTDDVRRAVEQVVERCQQEG